MPRTTTAEDHLRDLIVQVIFTCPGERINLPEFGVGIQRLIFEPSSDAMRSGAQFLISTNLQRWLGDRIDVVQVQVTSEPGYEETVTIEIIYTVKNTRQQQKLQSRRCGRKGLASCGEASPRVGQSRRCAW